MASLRQQITDAQLSGITGIEWEINIEHSLAAHLGYNKGVKEEPTGTNHHENFY